MGLLSIVAATGLVTIVTTVALIMLARRHYWGAKDAILRVYTLYMAWVFGLRVRHVVASIEAVLNVIL